MTSVDSENATSEANADIDVRVAPSVSTVDICVCESVAIANGGSTAHVSVEARVGRVAATIQELRIM